MAYPVIVKGLLDSVTAQQITEYFTFCGKVKTVQLAKDSENEKLNIATVTFEKPAAVKTALLLSDSEIGGSKVSIHADADTIAAVDKDSGTESPNNTTTDGAHNDIGQEYKPRSVILAEYLSHGYVLGDRVVARGLEYDEKHGIYNRFTSFLKDLDDKYKIREKSEATDKHYGITNKATTTSHKLGRYFDFALNKSEEKTGLKIKDYYQDLVKNVNDVHSEARRIADLKKEQASIAASNGSAPSEK